jgi:hypothetical protein
MSEEQLEFDFMIKGNQNFEGVGMNPDFNVITTDNTGNIAFGAIPTPLAPAKMYDQNHRNREIILLLQVQFPETYKQIMDALKARDALVDGQW